VGDAVADERLATGREEVLEIASELERRQRVATVCPYETESAPALLRRRRGWRPARTKDRPGRRYEREHDECADHIRCAGVVEGRRERAPEKQTPRLSRSEADAGVGAAGDPDADGAGDGDGDRGAEHRCEG